MDFGDNPTARHRRANRAPPITSQRASDSLPARGAHFVSHHNYFGSLDRLARSRDGKPELSEAIAGLSRFSLRDVLNNDEIVNLYQHKTTLEIIKQWADSGASIDIEEIREDLRRSERFFVPQYVLKVNTPRYHANPACEFLRASFENFETPPEISRLGPDKVHEFQAFCDKEWPRYKDEPADYFWAHVGSHFRIPISPKKISYTSSDGPMDICDQSEVELMDGVHRSAESVRRFAEANGLRGYLHAPAKKLYSLTKDENLELGRRSAFLDLLKLKKAIKMLVFNFHRIELKMSENLLAGELLAALGFLPCKACCGVTAPSADFGTNNP